MTTTTRRSTRTLLVGAAFVASLALASAAGTALAGSEGSSSDSGEPATMLAKVGAVQGRMSVAV
jgi:hypothetical protein